MVVAGAGGWTDAGWRRRRGVHSARETGFQLEFGKLVATLNLQARCCETVNGRRIFCNGIGSIRSVVEGAKQLRLPDYLVEERRWTVDSTSGRISSGSSIRRSAAASTLVLGCATRAFAATNTRGSADSAVNGSR